MTRLFSCLYGSTLSVGRVQSPTLAMLAEREAAIAAFAPEPFYTPVIDCGAFAASGGRLSDAAAADAVRAAADGQTALVLSVEKTGKAAAPPKLFDLTALQRETNALFGFTAQQTLDYAQALYEHKYITYPRTDSRYLTADMAGGLEKLVNLTAMRLPFIKVPISVNTEAVTDNSKVSDHHAIIPTIGEGAARNALPDGERAVLDTIIVRLVCAVSGPLVYETATAALECGGHRFAAKSKTVTSEGWKATDAAFHAMLKTKPDDDGGDSENETALPELAEGQAFPSVAASVREGKTKPPARYTEGTLLRAMETAGSEEFDPDTERKGLGTSATRAGVIEKLIKSGFVDRRKKLLVPTDKGINLIDILPAEIKTPLLTAEWEQKLLQVQRGELDAAEFMGGIAALTQGLVAAHTAPVPAFASLFASPPKGALIGKCPRCGADVTESPKGFFCSSRACKFALWKDSRFWEAKGKKLDKETAAALLSEGRVFFSDLHSEKTGKTYAASVILEDTGERVNYKLDFKKGGTA